MWSWYALSAGAGFLLGGVIAWLWAVGRVSSRYSEKLHEAETRATTLEGRAVALEETINRAREENEKRAGEANERLERLQGKFENEQKFRTQAETQLKETAQRLEEEKKLLDEAKAKLTEAFKALAGDALQNSNRSFLELARQTFDKILAEAKGDLGRRQEAINGLVRPLSDSLKQFEEHIQALERNRQQAYTSLEEQLKYLSSTQQQLQKETGNLVTALRSPQVRGRWGEITLIRVVELAGMTDHCDFTEQFSVETEEGRIRPDLVVHLPAEREIVVDAKVSLEAYLNALSAESQEQRQDCLNNHARQLRSHMSKLSGKAYWQQFKKTPEFVVMFIPGESFFSAAVEQDHGLIEDGMKSGVIMATPTTLIALLRAVAFGWRQEQIAKNAQEISELGKQLYERMRVMANHLTDMGKNLAKANESYNKAVGSIETRVLPAVRRFRDLGAVGGDEIAVVEPVETTPRRLTAPELVEE